MVPVRGPGVGDHCLNGRLIEKEESSSPQL